MKLVLDKLTMQQDGLGGGGGGGGGGGLGV